MAKRFIDLVFKPHVRLTHEISNLNDNVPKKIEHAHMWDAVSSFSKLFYRKLIFTSGALSLYYHNIDKKDAWDNSAITPLFLSVPYLAWYGGKYFGRCL